MAVSMAAVLSFPNANVIMGQKFTCTLALTESGGTNTNLVSIQPYVLGGDNRMVTQGLRIGAVANAATIAGYTGAAVTIGANTTSNFNFEMVIDNPNVFHGNGECNSNYTISAVCQTSDGSVFSPVPQVIGVALPMSGVPGSISPAPNGLLNQSVILGTTTNQYSNVISGGAARFDVGPNSYLLTAVF